MASARADTSPRHSSHSAGSMRRHVYVSCDDPPGTTRALNVLMDVCARKAGRAPLSVCIMHYVRMSFYAGSVLLSRGCGRVAGCCERLPSPVLFL